MEEKKACCHKTSIGGQALIEGVMMRGPKLSAMATRMPDQSIDTETWENKGVGAWYKKVPFIRGIFNLVDSLVIGYTCLMKSAEKSGMDLEDEEPGKFEKWLTEKLGDSMMKVISGFAMVLGVVLALLLFMVIPTYAIKFLDMAVPLGGMKTALEGILKIAIFILYLALVARMPDIRRVFEYHGAEHKTIACYEAGDALTVENVRKYTRFHPRCGTSFLILVVIVSVFLYSVLPWSSTGLRVVFKLLLLPLVMGISYELLKWCGRSDNIATRIIRQPGIWVQHLTVFEPDDSMIEVAIAAVTPVLPEGPEDGRW